MPILHDLLWAKNLQALKSQLRLLGPPPKGTRKAEMIEQIKSHYSKEGLLKIWQSLNQLDQQAVSEACYDLKHRLHETRFEAKYDSEAKLFIENKESRSWSRYEQEAAPLQQLLFHIPSEHAFEVPSDLVPFLVEFVPAPRKAQLKNSSILKEHPDLTIALTELNSLADLANLLHMAESGQLKISEKTGIPSAAGSRKISSNLAAGDFYPSEIAFIEKRWPSEQEIGYIKPIAWSLLLSNAKLISTKGSKTELTSAGIKALSMEPHEIIDKLWKRWIEASKFDEFKRINDIKGQSAKGHMTAVTSRRHPIAAALSECPVESWVSVDDFSNYMQATGQHFEVSRNTYKLYIGDPEYGHFGYSEYGEWNTVQFRYLLCLLFEYAATLGLIDVAFKHPLNAREDYRAQWGTDDLKWLSRYDGLEHFRLTSLGAYCLGITKEFKASRPASNLKLSVFTNLTIKVTAGSPNTSENLLLETWAQPLKDQTWSLDAERAINAVERGRNIQDFTNFLQEHEEQPLPESVEGFLRSCESDGKALKRQGAGIFFECRDSRTAELICAQKPLHNKCFQVGDTGIVVLKKEEKALRKIVRELGLGIV